MYIFIKLRRNHIYSVNIAAQIIISQYNEKILNIAICCPYIHAIPFTIDLSSGIIVLTGIIYINLIYV